jgi:hypothetical protein
MQHLKVYFFADMLGIENLKVFAAERFNLHLEQQWVGVDFPKLVQEVYSNTTCSDKKLRDIVVLFTQMHPELRSNSGLQAVMEEHNEFATGLAMALLSKLCVEKRSPFG